jgi:predicted acylesterase/phospholipase RssA
LPGFFKPARLRGVDYVDGGVRRTANIDVAIEQGADLVICYNPFRPFLNTVAASEGVGRGRYLSDGGMLRVFNQVFRTMLHTRLALGLQAYLRDDRFQGDIIVIEARETDEKFFGVNPLAFWKRSESVRHGFESVRRTLLDHREVLNPLLERYGMSLREPEEAPVEGRAEGVRSPVLPAEGAEVKRARASPPRRARTSRGI